MCISASPISEEKNRIMDMSYPITFDETSILMPYPKESDKIAVLAKPFTSQVQTLFLKKILLYRPTSRQLIIIGILNILGLDLFPNVCHIYTYLFVDYQLLLSS